MAMSVFYKVYFHGCVQTMDYRERVLKGLAYFRADKE